MHILPSYEEHIPMHHLYNTKRDKWILNTSHHILSVPTTLSTPLSDMIIIYNLISIPLFSSSATQFKFKNEFIVLIAMTGSALPQTFQLSVVNKVWNLFSFSFPTFFLLLLMRWLPYNILSTESFLASRLLIKFIFLVGLYSVSQYLTVIRLYCKCSGWKNIENKA